MSNSEEQFLRKRVADLEERLAHVVTPKSMLSKLEQGAFSTEAAAEDAVSIYLAAKAELEAWQRVCDAARDRMGEIMLETGLTSFQTRVGAVSTTKPSVVVSYDHKALDALAKSSPELAVVLAPHRTEKERPGYMRITGAK